MESIRDLSPQNNGGNKRVAETIMHPGSELEAEFLRHRAEAIFPCVCRVTQSKVPGAWFSIIAKITVELSLKKK